MAQTNEAFPAHIKGNPFLEFCWRRTRQRDNNCIIFVLGEPGSGKSLFALNCAWWLDRMTGGTRPRFSLKNVVFTSKDFKNRVNSCKFRGQCIIWEEPYIGGLLEGGVNSRDFMKKENKKIAGLFGTMRHNNHVIFLTMPLEIMFDSQARQMCHGYVVIDQSTVEYSFAKFYRKKINPLFRKEYFKQLTFNYDSFPSKLTSIITPLPPQNLVAAYREKADWYKNKWSMEYEHGTGIVQKNAFQKREENYENFLRDFQANPGRYRETNPRRLKSNRFEGFVVREIIGSFGTSNPTAINWLRRALHARRQAAGGQPLAP